jgi:hypothetical protein
VAPFPNREARRRARALKALPAEQGSALAEARAAFRQAKEFKGRMEATAFFRSSEFVGPGCPRCTCSSCRAFQGAVSIAAAKAAMETARAARDAALAAAIAAAL